MVRAGTFRLEPTLTFIRPTSFEENVDLSDPYVAQIGIILVFKFDLAADNYSHCQKYVLIYLLKKIPLSPFVKWGTYEGLKVYQHTYGKNDQCRSVSVSPFFKRGARGDFILSHTPTNRNIFMTTAIN